ncbi:hypothetical protein NQ314_005302 [Rhamnusium bicolor]|uniref:Uncharacterized protein n=1 Tax=Rhamnusium bicolor TaxID=1586634 RepID=A0AAV8ZIH2_9CUCU|nr:hypothetical protein NQ314_005302 [Rhamnusium bicolor]
MEIAIIKKETTGSGPNTFTENVTIAKYEIMDGAPVRVLMDTEDRRYFKQQEITLWRKGDKVRKPNLQSPAIMAGTQNLQNTAQQYQQTDDRNDSETKAPVKEDFLRAPNSQSNDKLNSADPFDQRVSSPTESPENQIQNMTREAGDGQNDNGNENAE